MSISRWNSTTPFAGEKMCFLLFIACDAPVPTIPWDENDRKLNTQDLHDSEKPIIKHFSKSHYKYIGSDEGCGCGFRNITYYYGKWPDESMIGSEYYTGEEEQPNHEQLFDFLKTYLRKK
jgi:hypothetical protein